MEPEKVSQWTLLSIIWCLILPYVMYTLYIYVTQKRMKVYFEKRKRFLIDLVLALVLSGIFIENQLLIFLSIYSRVDNVFGEFLHFFNMSSMIGIYMIIMERIYLLYFQYQYNEATISAKWMEYVNEKHEDFFLSNIHTYGDDKFLFRLTAIIWLIFSAIYIILDFLIPSTSYSSWFILIIFFFLFIFAVYIWRKFPHFHDTLYIRKELQYFLSLNFLMLFIWSTAILLAIRSRAANDIIREYLQVLMYCVIFEISINRVIKWNEVKISSNDENDVFFKQMNDKSFGFKQVIQTNNGYAQFMQFLVTEFATENLLFVTEYVQLKSILSLSDREMRSLKLTYNLALPPDLPIPKIIQDLNLDLEQIKANQKYRKEKQLKREKETLKRECENKKKLMQEILNAKNKHITDEAKQTEIEMYTVALTSSASISPLRGEITNNQLIEEEPTPTLSTKVHSENDESTNVLTPTSVAVIKSETNISANNNEQKMPETALQSDYSHESTMIIDAKQNESDLYGVPLDEENAEIEIKIDRIKSLQMIKTAKINQPNLEKHAKSFSPRQEQKEEFQHKAAPKTSEKYEKQIFLHEILKQKPKKRKQSDPTLHSPTLGPSLGPSKYSKDDINMIESIKLKDRSRKSKKDRPQSMHLRFSGKHGKTESNTFVRLQFVSSRVRNRKQMLKNHIREKSKKVKSKMSYHMREASQSMALKMHYKKNDKFNVLDTKSFSILCTKLHYKYIATGMAPLEVNISSAARIRCNNTFGQPINNQEPEDLKRPRNRSITKGVVNLLSRRNNLIMRNGAMNILRESDGYIMRSKSKKKLTMMNREEPFDGDIVRAMSQLLPPLEQCAIELTNLLKDSLRRFKKTKNCLKLYGEYVERKGTLQMVNDLSDVNKNRNNKYTI